MRLVVFDGYGTNLDAEVKGTLVKKDGVLVVDAGAFWEDEQRAGPRVGHMCLHLCDEELSVRSLGTVEDERAIKGKHPRLDEADEAAVLLRHSGVWECVGRENDKVDKRRVVSNKNVSRGWSGLSAVERDACVERGEDGPAKGRKERALKTDRLRDMDWD